MEIFLSYIVEYFTKSCIVCRCCFKNPNLGDAKFKGIYLLDPDLKMPPDPENHRIKRVQIINLEDKIKNYKGRIYVRKLHCN